MKPNEITVSDIITEKDVDSWQDGDIVSISAPTGKGKSHFIKHSLAERAFKNGERIIMFLHRNQCIEQFTKELMGCEYASAVDIKTYQSVETMERFQKEFDFSQYKYIVVDEMHYFLDDSSFNKYTDLSLGAILNQKDKTRIFMSATGDDMNEFLEDYNDLELIKYELAKDFKHIRNITLFDNDKFIIDIIQDVLRRGEKMILFFEGAERAYKYYREFKDISLFNCSESNRTHSRYVDRIAIKELLENERASDDVSLIFTTMCMDAGLNIHDEKFRNVFYYGKLSVSQLIQCMGRTRIQHDNHKLHIYMKNHNNQKIGGHQTQIQNKFIFVNDFLTLPINDFIIKHGREMSRYGDIVYDTVVDGIPTKKVNSLAYHKILKDMDLIKAIKDTDNGNLHDYLKELFGIEGIFFYNGSSVVNVTLSDYLSYIEGVELYKEAQEELKRILELNGYGRRSMGINTINGILKDGKFGYTISSKKDNRRSINGEVNLMYKKTYWIICKHDDVEFYESLNEEKDSGLPDLPPFYM